MRDVSCVTPPDVTRHTYSPESAAVTWGMRRRVPDTWGGDTREKGDTNPSKPPKIPFPPQKCSSSVPYLVLGREGPATLVPGDGGLSLPGHDAVEVQGLSLGDGGGRGLNAHRGGDANGWGQRWEGHPKDHGTVPRSPVTSWSPLTVRAGTAGLDRHHDGGFLGGGPAGHPAHVLARVGRCHLQQPQPGARYLWGGDTGVTGAT